LKVKDDQESSSGQGWFWDTVVDETKSSCGAEVDIYSEKTIAAG
jgi:hypothetical protein